MFLRQLTIGLLFCFTASTATAASPTPLPKKDETNALKKVPWSGALQFLTTVSPDALAGALRGFLIHNLPPVLYEKTTGWGNTKRVPNGVHWTEKGRLHPETRYRDRNDGVWRKIRVTADNLPNSLVLDIRNVKRPTPGKLTFEVFLSLDAKIDYQQQKWKAGLRLYDFSTRARTRINAGIQCEVTTKLEPSGAILPDAVLRFQITGANVSYDHFVVEHIAGIGGEMAKLLGDAVKAGIRRWDPNKERTLLAKANAAIVKAGANKEVRVSLMKLLNAK